jgi:ubiquinone/menaquinone biosynthesis C-methylase UbiE
MHVKVLIFILLIIGKGYSMGIISHTPQSPSFLEAFRKLEEKIDTRQDLSHISKSQQLEILNELSQFELGRFLIERRGVNGFWTHYVASYPEKPKTSLSSLEVFLLEKAPTCVATQERFAIFKREIRKKIKEECFFASVPSGLMAEFLDQDFSSATSVKLEAIDLDLETLEQAKEYAQAKEVSEFCRFTQNDAWNLESEGLYDLIASNGLTIYEPDDKNVLRLFQRFFKALKVGGTLVTSFLTPPPIPGKSTEWDMNYVNSEDALLQKIIFTDILGAKWQVFRSEQTVRDLLNKAGFQEIEIFFDKAHIFPTITATKK